VRRRSLLLAGPGLALPAAALAQPAAYPSRPVRVLVGYPPGGSTDVAGRLLAEQLGRRLGQTVIVENRAGAAGQLGAAAVARADADGHTLLLAASPEVSIAPVTTKALPYDPLRDLQPVTLVGQIPFLLVVHPSVPGATLAEFVAQAKAQPGRLNYASFGNNTSNHLAGELFKSLAGVDAVHVPYKGSGPAVTDLIGGQVQYAFDGPPAVMEHVRAGRLRALAVAAAERLPGAPQIPTFAEAATGPLAGFTGGTWFGLFAPARTPPEIVQRLNAETVAALRQPELAKAFADRSILASPQTPEQFGRFVQGEVAKWRALAARIGIVPE
jgi:tripartite-type tricarboxylate transporter receptor subunit TctC